MDSFDKKVFNRHRVSRRRRTRMRGKVIVGDGEDIGQALKRLRRLVCQDRAIDKWPVWAGHHAAPNEQRRRKEWLRALTCDGRGHGKRLRKGDKQQSSNQ